YSGNDTNTTVLFHRFCGIVENVVEHLRQLGWIAQDGLDFSELQFDIQRLVELGLKQMTGCVQQGVEITSNEIRLIDVGKGFQIGDDRSDTARPTGGFLQQRLEVFDECRKSGIASKALFDFIDIVLCDSQITG